MFERFHNAYVLHFTQTIQPREEVRNRRMRAQVEEARQLSITRHVQIRLDSTRLRTTRPESVVMTHDRSSLADLVIL